MRIFTPITLTNSQSQASPSNFQQLIQTTIQYPNGVRFWSPTDGYLPAWLESIQPNSANIWVKIPSSIPANGTYQLYMIQDSTLPMDGVYWGEAPQLSSTYAEYDNGESVFPYYQRWGGLSSLPSGWSSISGTVITYASSYIEISPSSSGWQGISINSPPSSLVSTQTVWEFYGNIYNESFGYIGTNTGSEFGNYQGYNFYESGSPPTLSLVTNGTYYFTNNHDTNTNKIYTMQMNSATNVQMFINYSQIYSNSNLSALSPNSFQIGTANRTGVMPYYLYWLRTRALPPNGVMPTTSFGASQYSGELITVTVP